MPSVGAETRLGRERLTISERFTSLMPSGTANCSSARDDKLITISFPVRNQFGNRTRTLTYQLAEIADNNIPLEHPWPIMRSHKEIITVLYDLRSFYGNTDTL